MSAPDLLRPLARRDGDPVFEEAWQAQALAMADCLAGSGVFSRSEWAEALGEALQNHDDTTEGYYRSVLAALETLLMRGSLSRTQIEARRDAWIRAYERTPHGKAVELENSR